jgi:hypothetical protein
MVDDAQDYQVDATGATTVDGVRIASYDPHKPLFPRMRVQAVRWTRELACQFLKQFDSLHADPFWDPRSAFGTFHQAHDPWSAHGGMPPWVRDASVPGDFGLTGHQYLAGTMQAESGRTMLNTAVPWDRLPRFFGVDLSFKAKSASLQVMDQANALARINEAKFGLTSKNTIVAVVGNTKPGKKFHHMKCHVLFPKREKTFVPGAPGNPSGVWRKPQNHCYRQNTYVCRVEVARRYNYASCNHCFSKFSAEQQHQWKELVPLTNSEFNAYRADQAASHPI